VENTLFFSKVNMQSVMVVKAILMCFEFAYGLKVNYSKSIVGGEGISSNDLLRFSSLLNCGIMKASFTYFGYESIRD